MAIALVAIKTREEKYKVGFTTWLNLKALVTNCRGEMIDISGYLKVSKNGGEYSKQGQFKSSLRDRRSKEKGKGIRARDHARGRREEGFFPFSLARQNSPFPFPLLTPATQASYSQSSMHTIQKS